ncbi:MAG TPA: Ti-type conjugative transfer relaxase TraA [Steroidobacteraceae bacterium]
MAIYHYSQKPVSRARGRSAVAGAAYRSASKLYDQRLGQTFDYTRRRGVEHAEIVLPSAVPGDLGWARNREVLWNAAEASEKRKDARIAREHEVALPAELNRQQQIELLRAFSLKIANRYHVAVDFALHRPHRKGDQRNFHAHIYSTTREVTPTGLGRKAAPELSDTDRARRGLLLGREELRVMRAKWAEVANEHLAYAGLEIRIDHRTLEAQGIDLVPGIKLGLSRERQRSPDLPHELAEKVAEQRAIAAENGRRILEDPSVALKAIRHHQATFTTKDIGKYLHTRTDGAEQFQAAYLKVTTSPELVKLGVDERGRMRFSTREMVALERGMLERAQHLAATREHAVSHPVTDERLSKQQRKALEHVTGQGDLAVLVGIAGAGKSTMLSAARRTWEEAGYSVKGAALAGVAAENLEKSSQIPARTLASWEWHWDRGRELLGKGDVLVIDEAGLVGTRQLAYVMEKVEQAGAKVVLVGDPEQLQAIEAGAAFRGIAERADTYTLTEVWRQKKHAWQQEATQQFFYGRTAEGLEAYGSRGYIHALSTRDEARQALLAAWWKGVQEGPEETRLMLAYTNKDVRALNAQARELRRAAGQLGQGEMIETERGAREFTAGDRLYFLAPDHSLGVKNGTLGTVERIRGGVLQVRLDGDEGRRVAVDAKQYPHLDHGYAATTHKSQGVTVDRSFVLATPHFDRHAIYVGLSRHRESATVFYGREDFQPSWSRASAEENFRAVLSRDRSKDLAHDYLPGGRVVQEHAVEPKTVPPPAMTVAERLRQRADQVAQRLASEREQERTVRQGQAVEKLDRQHTLEQQRKQLEQEIAKQHELDHDPGLEL